MHELEYVLHEIKGKH
jgi:hypothetical protein